MPLHTILSAQTKYSYSVLITGMAVYEYLFPFGSLTIVLTWRYYCHAITNVYDGSI